MNATDFLAPNAGLAYFTIVDYSIFGTLLAVSVAIGLYYGIFSKEKQSTDVYLHGGHQMKALPISISLVTSFISATSITATTTEAYSYGWLFLLMIPAMILVALAANFLIIPVFFANKLDNCYEYLEKRFSKRVRNIICFTFVFFNLYLIPMVMYVPSLAFVEMTGHNLYVVNTFVCYCCVIYTLLGGIKAVVWTDVVQGTVMLLSIFLIAFYGVRRVGDLTEVWNRSFSGGRISAPKYSIDLTSRHSFWSMLLGCFFNWAWHLCFEQRSFQRFMATPSLSKSRRSIVYFAIGICIFSIFSVHTGLVMYAYYHDCDPVQAKIVDKSDNILAHFVLEIGANVRGMAGIFISFLFSASLSTVSVSLNSLAGILYMDYILPLKIFRHTEKNANRTMKIIIFIIGTYSVLGVYFFEKFGSLFHVMHTVNGICNGTTFGVFTLGMLYPWANKHGAFYGILIGMATILAIIVNTQIAIGSGELYSKPIVSSIEGCDNVTIISAALKSSFLNETIIPESNSLDDSFAFYKISFLWYPVLGVLITWSTGIIVSYFTGGQNLNELDVNLLSPCIKTLLPEKYKPAQLQVLLSDENKTLNDVVN